jgi:hypothetical protein
MSYKLIWESATPAISLVHVVYTLRGLYITVASSVKALMFLSMRYPIFFAQ